LLEEKYKDARQKNEHLENLFAQLQLDMNFFQENLNDPAASGGNNLVSFRRIYLELLETQREMLTSMNQRDEFDEDLIRKYLTLIDMEEFKIREKQIQRV
jgi:CPA1 family monovalent cation:H+ antiporter